MDVETRWRSQSWAFSTHIEFAQKVSRTHFADKPLEISPGARITVVQTVNFLVLIMIIVITGNTVVHRSLLILIQQNST